MAQELDLADGEETSSAEISNDISIICREEKVPTYYASETSSADISIINREEKVPTLYASDSSGFCSDVDKRISGGYFGDVKIKNSKGITIGNQATLKGDVTINQYIYPDKVKEENPWTDCLPEPPNCVTLKNGKLDSKSDFRPKSNPILQITQQNSVSEKGFVREWWRWMSCAFAGAFLVMVILVFTIGLVNKQNSDEPKSPKQYPFIIPANLTEEDKMFLNGTSNKFITRTEWAARGRTEETKQKLPVSMVIIAHTATEQCNTTLNCIGIIKQIQDFHMDSRNWDDIAYNYLVSGSGDIFIGRGSEYYGSHTKGYNVGSIGIALVGTFTNQPLPLEQAKATKLLLKVLLLIRHITEDYSLYAHRQLISTDSPGAYVYAVIKQWPHWKST